MATKIFFSGVAVFLVLAPLFYFGIIADLFIKIWWWDILMHGLGGMWAGYIGVWFAIEAGQKPKPLFFLAGAIILGGFVEIAEYYTDFGRSPFFSYPVDTGKDMIIDAIGGLIAAAVSIRKRS